MIHLQSMNHSASKSNPRILFVAPTASFINLRLSHFLRLFRLNGWEVDVACQGSESVTEADRQFDIPFAATPYDARNLEAYSRLKSIVDESHYELIQCHELACGAVARWAARDARKNGSKVIYAIFGAFSFQRAPYGTGLHSHYSLEKLLATHTDLIVTTKQEDYVLAKDRRFSNCECMCMHGAGVDVEKFAPVSSTEKMALRDKLGIGSHERVLLCANDWEEKHNQKMLIHGLAVAEERDHRLRLYLLGDGPRMEKLKAFVKSKKLERWVHFPGHVDNVNEWLQASDVVLSASDRVSHASALLEAMACGIPIVASHVRGHTDIVVNRCSGILFQLENVEDLARGIFAALAHQKEIGAGAREMAMLFSYDSVLREMSSIYEKLTSQCFSRGIAPKTDTEPDFLSVQYAVR